MLKEGAAGTAPCLVYQAGIANIKSVTRTTILMSVFIG
nr:MAG TPA: hypothetical protein [Caudoviricetes sp.]